VQHSEDAGSRARREQSITAEEAGAAFCRTRGERIRRPARSRPSSSSGALTLTPSAQLAHLSCRPETADITLRSRRRALADARRSASGCHEDAAGGGGLAACAKHVRHTSAAASYISIRLAASSPLSAGPSWRRRGHLEEEERAAGDLYDSWCHGALAGPPQGRTAGRSEIEERHRRAGVPHRIPPDERPRAWRRQTYPALS
jgi:hypothetical protein